MKQEAISTVMMLAQGATLSRPSMQQRDLLHLIDADLERRLLGGILSAGERAYREASLLNPDDFGVEQHRIIFGVMQRIAPEVDPTLNAVIHALGEIGKLDSVGGITALLDIDQAALPGDGLAVHAKTLRGQGEWPAGLEARGQSNTLGIELHGTQQWKRPRRRGRCSRAHRPG